MALRDVFPIKYVRDKFEKELIVKEYDLSTVEELAKEHPEPLVQIGLCIWHQVVTRRLFPVNPQAVRRYVDSPYPFLYKKIEELLALQVVFDLYNVNARVRDDSLGEDNECCQMCLAHTYPNDVVLADVTFENPYKPVPKRRQRYRYTYYEGLSLLPVFMERLKEYCLQSDKDRIVLTAAARDLVPLFGKYGFQVDDSLLAKVALKAGGGIPMQLLFK